MEDNKVTKMEDYSWEKVKKILEGVIVEELESSGKRVDSEEVASLVQYVCYELANGGYDVNKLVNMSKKDVIGLLDEIVMISADVDDKMFFTDKDIEDLVYLLDSYGVPRNAVICLLGGKMSEGLFFMCEKLMMGGYVVIDADLRIVFGFDNKYLISNMVEGAKKAITMADCVIVVGEILADELTIDIEEAISYARSNGVLLTTDDLEK